MPSVTRATLARAVARRVGVGHAQARAQVACVVAALAEALVRGEVVKLRGVGSLSVCRRGPRRVMHPRLGRYVDVGDSARVMFRPARARPLPAGGRR